MEILALIAVFFLLSFARPILRLMFAGAKSAVTGESLGESLGYLKPMEIRLVDNTGDEFEYTSVEVRGLFPIQHSHNVAYIISIFDITSSAENRDPVLSIIEHCQEPNTTSFQLRANVGRIDPEQGFKKWIEIGRILPLFLQSPMAGARKLLVYVRLVDTGNEPDIHLGLSSSNDGLLWVGSETIYHRQQIKGYLEEFEDREESLVLSVKLSMAVAMADGSLDDAEGITIRSWMQKVVSPFGQAKQEALKQNLNTAMKEAFAQANGGDFSLSPIVARMNAIADETMKFEAMELCYDVMAADGKADSEEMKMLRQLGEALELDTNEIEKIRDIRMIDISDEVDSPINSDELMGIDPNWDQATVRRHLRKEFQKWNSRLNNLSAGKDRDHAQRMLDMIGEARKKYG